MEFSNAPSSAPALFEQAPAAKGVFSTFSPKHIGAVAGVKRRNLKVALKSGKNFHKYIQTPGSNLGPANSATWINDGMLLWQFRCPFERIEKLIQALCDRSPAYSSVEANMAVVQLLVRTGIQ